MSQSDYLSQIQALLPHGPAWPRDAGSFTTRWLDSLAAEISRVDGRAAQMLLEADPRTTYEMLGDWERVTGLSDSSPIDGSALSTIQRRNTLLTKLVERGGQSHAYFVALAARLGFVVTITEFREWNVTDDVEAELNGVDWNFAWRINTAASAGSEWTVEDNVEASFSSIWLNMLFESALHEDKPAHSVLLINYL